MSDTTNGITGKNELLTAAEKLQTGLEDIKNIVQLLEMSLANNKDDEHIIRSVNIINRMIETSINEDTVALMETIQKYFHN